jgi:hypothetical protein
MDVFRLAQADLTIMVAIIPTTFSSCRVRVNIYPFMKLKANVY